MPRRERFCYYCLQNRFARQERSAMPADTYDAIWAEITEKVKSFENIDPRQTVAFFNRLHLQAFSDGFLMLTAENDFTKTWVESHYLGYINQALEEIYHMPFTVAIEVDTNIVSPVIGPETRPSTQPVEPGQSQNTSQPASVQESPAPSPLQTPTVEHQQDNIDTVPSAPASTSVPTRKSLSSSLTFDNFVVGSSNNLAYSMALSVAESPGSSKFNPLFIYGRSGLGKTHLLRAIKNYVEDVYPEMKAIYVDASSLAADYSEAGRKKSFDEFHNRYDTADVLLVDDMQSIAGKEGTIEQLFNIFNNMLESGRQVIFAADRSPNSIDVDERSRSRWNSGIACDIQPPELETKIGIIKNCIDDYRVQRPQDTFEIGSDVQEYIAQISGSNIRELISAVTKVIVDCVEHGETSVRRATVLLQDHFRGGINSKLTVETIQSVVEEYYNISHADLVGKKRTAHISHARQMAIYLCRTLLDVSFQAIGKEFNRDHSTAMHSHNLIDQKVKENIEVSSELERLKEKIIER